MWKAGKSEPLPCLALQERSFVVQNLLSMRRSQHRRSSSSSSSSSTSSRQQSSRSSSKSKSKSSNKLRAPKSFRTLIPLLDTYVGQQVTVELKNDTEIVGIIDEVMYPKMNLVLVNCIIKRVVFEFNPNDYNGDEEMWLGKSKSFRPVVQWAQPQIMRVDRTFVQGSTVRYVHFPDRVSVHKQLAAADKSARSSKQLYERGVRPTKKNL